MRRKRNIPQLKKRRRRFEPEPAKSSAGPSLTSRILAYLYAKGQTVSLNQLIQDLSLTRSASEEINSLLARLSAEQVVQTKSNRQISLGSNHRLCEGVLDKNARGFGFVTKLWSKTGRTEYTRDPYISQSRMGQAQHGDRLLIQIQHVGKDGRAEADIIAILQRGTDHLAGFVQIQGTSLTVIPEDPRYPMHIQVQGQIPAGLHDGDAVIVKLLEGSEGKGTIIDVLGDPDSIDVQMRLVIEKFNLPHQFSAKALSEAESGAEGLDLQEVRDDLRATQFVTIDGETAKDFDDAVAVQKTRNGFRLLVAIADVSYFVRPGTILDQEAYERGTSIYFPGRVIPMLPERLSNDLCSLVPDQDRLTFTAILDFDRHGHRTGKRFTKSIIRSHKRFTYNIVSQILIDRDPALRREHKAFLTPLKWAQELATELMHRRRERGSIGFTMPEPEISLDETGHIASIDRAERNFAHQMIEEFMLAANEAVAETFTENKLVALYRIHERPDPLKVEEFSTFARALGLEVPPPRHDPDWFGHVLDLVKGSPREYVINNLLLRTMQQARYDSVNLGHFGLAAADYTHFTSPIRRYPDLMVHRALYSFLRREKKATQKQAEQVREAGTALSVRERLAVSAEREMNARLNVRYMQKRIGQDFAAVISGVHDQALFVELTDLFISGAVSIRALKDDFYLFDPKRYRLIGERSNRTFQIGDLIRVTLLDVDTTRNRINFTLAENQSATPDTSPTPGG